jgi:hypothetical protein
MTMKQVQRLLALSVVMPLLGGGFFLELGTPSASQDPKAKGAVVLAHFIGCHEPEKGVLTATAEGLVKGKRESVALKPVAMDRAGLFAIQRQWPAEGKWILRLVGKHPGVAVATTTLVRVTADGFERGSMVMKPGELGADAVEAMLR